MTDNEIIKALECCSQTHNCRECVLWEMHSAQCVSDLLSNALSLIKSQKAEIAEIQKNSETLAIVLVNAKAEIERLQQKYELSEAEREANVKGFTETLETVRAEAIKEFAERLKSTMFNEDFLLCEPCDMANIIDNLVKEMTEDGK